LNLHWCLARSADREENTTVRHMHMWLASHYDLLLSAAPHVCIRGFQTVTSATRDEWNCIIVLRKNYDDRLLRARRPERAI
jgi:hypothetical protein